MEDWEIRKRAAELTERELQLACAVKRSSSASQRLSSLLSPRYLRESRGSTTSRASDTSRASEETPTSTPTNTAVQLFGPLPNSSRRKSSSKKSRTSSSSTSHAKILDERGCPKRVFGPLPNSIRGGVGITCAWDHPLTKKELGAWCCDECGAMEMRGQRFGCAECNYDLCCSCYENLVSTLAQTASKPKSKLFGRRSGSKSSTPPRKPARPHSQPPRLPLAYPVDVPSRGENIINVDAKVDQGFDQMRRMIQVMQSVDLAVQGVDVDGDGKPDLFLMGRDKNGDGILDVLQSPQNALPQTQAEPKILTSSTHPLQVTKTVDLAAQAIDIDGDGEPDLILMGRDQNGDGLLDVLQAMQKSKAQIDAEQKFLTSSMSSRARPEGNLSFNDEHDGGLVIDESDAGQGGVLDVSAYTQQSENAHHASSSSSVPVDRMETREQASKNLASIDNAQKSQKSLKSWPSLRKPSTRDLSRGSSTDSGNALRKSADSLDCTVKMKGARPSPDSSGITMQSDSTQMTQAKAQGKPSGRKTVLRKSASPSAQSARGRSQPSSRRYGNDQNSEVVAAHNHSQGLRRQPAESKRNYEAEQLHHNPYTPPAHHAIFMSSPYGVHAKGGDYFYRALYNEVRAHDSKPFADK